MSEGKKKIIYILIAKGTKPLADYSEHTGDFTQQCENLLSKINGPSAAINLNNGYNIFYIIENDISYLVMADSLFPKSTAIGCIESIKKEFQSTYIGRDFESETEYGLNEDFKEKLKMKYEYYNENTEITSEALQQLKEQMIKMKDEVLEASGLLNQREEEIDSMNKKAESMAIESESYKKSAHKVKKAENKSKIYLYIGTGFVALLIIYFIICAICGSFTFQC